MAKELIVWSAFEISKLIFGILWLVFWLFSDVFVMAHILWRIWGREMVTLSFNILKIDRKLFNIGTQEEYYVFQVKNLRYMKNNPFKAADRDPWRFGDCGGGRIAFDYGMKSIRFAASISNEEADLIIGKLKSKGNIDCPRPKNKSVDNH